MGWGYALGSCRSAERKLWDTLRVNLVFAAAGGPSLEGLKYHPYTQGIFFSQYLHFSQNNLNETSKTTMPSTKSLFIGYHSFPSFLNQVLHRLCILGKVPDKAHTEWQKVTLNKRWIGLGANSLEPAQVWSSEVRASCYQSGTRPSRILLQIPLSFYKNQFFWMLCSLTVYTALFSVLQSCISRPKHILKLIKLLLLRQEQHLLESEIY